MAFLGVDIGGTTTRAALIDDLGHLLGDAQELTHVDGGVEGVLDSVWIATQAACDRVGIHVSAIDSICIGIPGAVDPDRNMVLLAPVLGWYEETDVVSVARERLDIPLQLASDALCAATGEAEFGAGNHYDDCPLLKLGTTVSLAVVRDGHPLGSDTELGRHVSNASVDDVEFHEFGSAGSLVRLAREAAETDEDSRLYRLGGHDLSRLDDSLVFEAARRDDAAALAAVERYADHVARGAKPLVVSLSPEAVVIAGSVARAGELLREPVARHLGAVLADSDTPCPDVVTSSIAPAIGAYGAAVIAMRLAGVDPLVEGQIT